MRLFDWFLNRIYGPVVMIKVWYEGDKRVVKKVRFKQFYKVK